MKSALESQIFPHTYCFQGIICLASKFKSLLFYSSLPVEDEVLSPGFKFKESKLLVFFSFLLFHFIVVFSLETLEDNLDQLFDFIGEESKTWKLSDLSK